MKKSRWKWIQQSSRRNQKEWEEDDREQPEIVVFKVKLDYD